MSGNNIVFNDKKIKKSNFYKSKKLFKTHEIDFDKILVSRKNRRVQNIHLNMSLNIMMMTTSLDHCVKCFLK